MFQHQRERSNCLTHWGRVTHICVGKLTIIGPDNGLSPGGRQAIIWTNAGILLIEHLGKHFSEILIKIDTFSFKKMFLKMSSGNWRTEQLSNVWPDVWKRSILWTKRGLTSFECRAWISNYTDRKCCYLMTCPHLGFNSGLDETHWVMPWTIHHN